MKYTKLIILLLFISLTNCKITTKEGNDIVQGKKEIQLVNVDRNDSKSNTEKDILGNTRNTKKTRV
ncbi:hypothetical protein [Tenacibaculum mesophilum]|uniref:hypothetical protein n=1 Tax=Tenacibaculum mesophilum TaxID=104268 RepID=UPI003F5DCE6B